MVDEEIMWEEVVRSVDYLFHETYWRRGEQYSKGEAELRED